MKNKFSEGKGSGASALFLGVKRVIFAVGSRIKKAAVGLWRWLVSLSVWRRIGEGFRAFASLEIWKKIGAGFRAFASLGIWKRIGALPWGKIGRKLLFPPTAIILVLAPLAALFLIYMLINGDGGPFSIASYILSFYALLVLSFRAPKTVAFIKRVKSGNRYLNRYFSDRELRGRISLYGALVMNIAYAIFQIGLGLIHSSLWYYSLGGYYILLSLSRFFLVRHDRKEESVRFMDRQSVCRLIGVLLLITTLALSGVILHMIQLEVVIVHHEITTIAMAAYTFMALTLAITNIVKGRGSRSLVFMVSKAISLVCALVSIITLENAMISAFGADDGGEFSRIMVAITGAAVCAIVAAIAIYIIVIANKRLQNNRISEENKDLEKTKID